MSEQGTLLPIVPVTEGPWRGWSTWGYDLDPFETLTGPFYMRETPAGMECATDPLPAHCNGGGRIHGGFLMTFADFAIFAIAQKALNNQMAVTLSLTSEFLSGGMPGERLVATGEVLRATRSLIFARGVMRQGGREVFAFNGILKKIGA
jgi:acyl-coenzyme A thioesterase 13